MLLEGGGMRGATRRGGGVAEWEMGGGEHTVGWQ
jgi:hypothetical protein